MANSDYSAILEIVPQVSYEIIGRIIPGIVVIISLFVVAMGPAQAWMNLDKAVIYPSSALSGWAVVLMLIAAYILSLVLNGVWQIPVYVRRRGEKPCQTDLKDTSTSFKFDEVNQKLPKAGAWLTKLYAEENATEVLIIGWVTSAAINTYCLATAFSVERLWMELCLIAGIIGAVTVRSSIITTRDNSLNNMWIILNK